MALIKVKGRGAENFGRRNLIINGAMQIAQRRPAQTYNQTPNSGNYHTVDRFSYRRQGTWSGVTAVALSQQTTGGPTGLPHFLRYAPTGSDSTTPANTSMYVDYKFEDKDTISLSLGNSDAKPFTLSFYVRSTVTGTFSVTFTDAASSPPYTRYVTTYTIDTANTWERKIISVPAITSGTWSTSLRSLSIYFMVSGDSDGAQATSTLNQWSTHGNADIRFATTQTEGMTNQTGQTWDITGVQLESGTTATDFEHRSFGEDLALCQRYYQKSYDYDVTPGASTQTGAVYNRYAGNVSNQPTAFNWPVTMCKNPAVTIYSLDGTAGSISDCATNLNHVSNDAANVSGTVGENGFAKLTGVTVTAGDIISFHYTADAEVA